MAATFACLNISHFTVEMLGHKFVVCVHSIQYVCSYACIGA